MLIGNLGEGIEAGAGPSDQNDTFHLGIDFCATQIRLLPNGKFMYDIAIRSGSNK
jgi:hypothetical protein